MDKQGVYEDIKQKIMEEKLLPGQWLVERELCESYGLSRTPIREILWRLCNDGLLHQESNRGFTVNRLNLDQILDVFQMREAVEGMAARLASSKGGNAFMAKLQALNNQLREVDIEQNAFAGVLLGRELHNAIVAAAGNGLMSDMYQKLMSLTILTSNLTRKSTEIERASRDAHLELIDALLKRDEDRSERVMREHLRDTCRVLVAQFYPGMLDAKHVTTQVDRL
ncbi:MAG: GntR family transcriptional regulator [Smithellaceae bacterium]|nr:GntR family transcriptional regulator [Smithellaceae bacterium]